MLQIINTNNFNQKISNGISVVDFFATWCGPCKMLSPVLEDLSKDLADVNFYKVDIDSDIQLALNYQISTVPTILIVKEGVVVDTLVGFVPKNILESKIKSHM